MAARTRRPGLLPFIESVPNGRIKLPPAPPVVRSYPWKDLDDTDGDSLDSHWHALAMPLLIELVSYHLRHRQDIYVGGNQFVYYRLPRTGQKQCHGPDFYFVDGVSRTPIRRYWVVAKEGKFPDLLIELNSPRSIKKDLTTKKTVYERYFRSPEYVCYDPDTQTLRGWRLVRRRYQSIIPDARGWLWLETLQLWVGKWVGEYGGYHDTWLRFYHPDGTLVLLKAEAEKQRAESAEAEIARLKAELVGKPKKNGKNGKNGQ